MHITLKSGGTTLKTQSRRIPTQATQYYMTGLTGFFDTPDLIRNSTPKLTGDGEYMSDESRFAPRDIEITLDAVGTPRGVFNMKEVLRDLKQDRALVSVAVQYDIDGDIYVETAYGYINNSIKYIQDSPKHVTASVMVHCPSPYKSRSVNGGSPSNII